MKRNIVRTICFATLLFGLAAAAAAQDAPSSSAPPTCTMAGRAGDYALTWTGTMVLWSSAVPAAGVARTTFDDAGNVSGTQTVSKGGTIGKVTIKGTYTVNPDCTGTITASIYNLAGNLSSNVTWATVSDDNMTETRLIMTSMVLADGTNVPVIISGNARKLFPASENSQSGR